MKTRKICVTMIETRIIQREFDVTEDEYNALQGDSDSESEVLKEMYDLVDSKYASSEYDYSVYDYKTDKMVVELFEENR